MVADKHARSRDRVGRACTSELDATELRVRLLAELRTVVGFDAYVWLMTDPRTAVGVAPLAEVPSLHELPRTIRLKYLSDVNRWTRLTQQAPVGLLRRDTGDDPSQSPFWLEVQRGYGVVDVASMVFVDRFGCWGFLDLWRNGTSPHFDEADVDHLTSLATAITTGLRATQARTFGAGPSPARPGMGPMVLVLNDELEVQSQTDATAEWLAVLLPTANAAPPIPAAAYNVAAQLLAVEQGIDEHPPSARVHLAHGLWVTLRAARLGSNSIAVTIEETTPSDRLELFGRCFGLTAREAELLDCLASGDGTRQLASRMYVSEHTVQDHLKAIFAKTAVHNRRSLLSRALGTR